MKAYVRAMMVLVLCGMGFMTAACADRNEPNGSFAAEMLSVNGQREEDTDFGVLHECTEILGQSGAEAARHFGGGKENRTADGKYFIGYTYDIALFGENLSASTILNAEGIVSGLNIYLSMDTPDFYRRQIEQAFGAPNEESRTPGEGGASYLKWIRPEGKEVFLYRSPGLCVIQMTLNGQA